MLCVGPHAEPVFCEGHFFCMAFADHQRQGNRDQYPENTPDIAPVPEDDFAAIPFIGQLPADAEAHELDQFIVFDDFHARAKYDIALVREMKDALEVKCAGLFAAAEYNRDRYPCTGPG